MKILYQCDNCKETSTNQSWIFHCLWCDKEICDSCMYGLAICKECAVNLSKEEIETRFNNDEDVY